MKNARLATNDKPSAPNSLDFTTAQNLSKYSRKVLSRTMVDASAAGYSVVVQNGQFVIVNTWGLRRAVSSAQEAAAYLGGLLQ